MTESRDSALDQMVTAARLLMGAGVLSHSGHATMSVRADDNDEERMLLTARGEIIDLSVEDIALVAFDGVVREGALTPTTREIVAMHAGVYRARDDVGALIHAHAPHVTACALPHRPLPAPTRPCDAVAWRRTSPSPPGRRAARTPRSRPSWTRWRRTPARRPCCSPTTGCSRSARTSWPSRD